MAIGDNISPIVVPITGDVSGLKAATDQANKHIDSFAKNTKDAGDKISGGMSVASSAVTALSTGYLALSQAARQAAQAFAIVAAAAKDAEEIRKSARDFGISTAALQAWRQAAQASGSDAGNLDRSIARLNQSIQAAIDGNKGAADALAALGLEAASLRAMGLEGATKQVAQSLAAMDDKAKALAIGTELLGRGFRDLSELFKDGAAGLDRVTEAAKEAGLVLSEMDLKKLADLDDALDKAGISAKNLTAQFSAGLAPALKKIAEESGKAAEKLGPTAKFAGEVVGKLSEYLSGKLKTGADAATAAVSGLQAAAHTVTLPLALLADGALMATGNFDKYKSVLAFWGAAAETAGSRAIEAAAAVAGIETPTMRADKATKEFADKLKAQAEAAQKAKEKLEKLAEEERKRAEAIEALRKEAWLKEFDDRMDALEKSLKYQHSKEVREWEDLGRYKESFDQAQRAGDAEREQKAVTARITREREAAERIAEIKTAIEDARRADEAKQDEAALKAAVARQNAWLKDPKNQARLEARRRGTEDYFDDAERRVQMASIEEDQKRMTELWAQGWEGRYLVTQEYANRITGVFSMLGNSMDKSSRKGFETWKAAATAQAIVDTIASAVASFKSLASIPYVGYALGAAAAAAALAAGYANVRKIQGTKFGDRSPPGGGTGYGSSPSSAGGAETGSAGSSSNVGGGPGETGPRVVTQTYNITLRGQSFGRDQVRGLLAEIQAAQADSGNVYNVATNVGA